MYGYKDLQKILAQNEVHYDTEKIQRAYELALWAHEGQLRKSGDAYIMHPVAVATILADFGLDTDSIAAALLHDVVEDTKVELATVRKEFGQDTALLVDGVTKLGKIPFSSREEQQAENIRKMLLAMSKDVRVIIIKLADRLHNIRTLSFMTEQKQRDIALETMEVYAPLAHRLGIRAIKEELEDTSLRYLDPIACEEIDGMMGAKREEQEQFLAGIKAKISERLDGKFPDLFIEGRIKSLYGAYRKVYIQNRSFDEIYDIYAVRVVVNTVNECYNILGEIHDMFRPIPSRFKDYISTPKPNMYQSLHTTVFDKSSIPFEVQIRTWEMHHTAEYGIAAHWKYKQGLTGKDSLDEKIAWVRQIIESQSDSVDAQEILGTIKTDLSADEVFVFTPKGDVISLPSNATVIDYAYAIHSEVGNRMVGAKVDGRMVALDTVVQTGNIINIITSNAPGQGPSRDWINIVKTAGTRNKIRSWFKRERKDENIQTGRTDFEKELRRNNIHLGDADMVEFVAHLTKSQKLAGADEFYAAIGYGGISLYKIMPRVKEVYSRQFRQSGEEEMLKQLEKTAAKRPPKSTSGVIVEGLDGCLVKFAKCCNPLPGDDIIGYITRGFGVSVHKKDCANVTTALDDENQSDRWVECEWAHKQTGELFKSTVDIYGRDRSGLLVDVSITLNNLHVPVYSLATREMPDTHTAIQISFGTSSTEQLRFIIKNLCKIDGIERVDRTMQ